MAEALDSQITTRVPSRVRSELEAVARDKQTTPLALARQFVEEGLRRERHPGIAFRDGSAGRRAGLEGRRLDVWQIMQTVWDSDGNVDDAAAYLGMRPEDVRTAVAYYVDYPDEIDMWVQRNRQEAERLEEVWQRQQAALRR